MELQYQPHGQEILKVGTTTMCIFRLKDIDI